MEDCINVGKKIDSGFHCDAFNGRILLQINTEEIMCCSQQRNIIMWLKPRKLNKILNKRKDRQ